MQKTWQTHLATKADHPGDTQADEHCEFRSEASATHHDGEAVSVRSGLDETLMGESMEAEPELPRMGAEDSIISVANHDLVKEDVWWQQQEILRSNSEKREQLRIQLERRRLLNKALLKEEEERREIQHMQNKVEDLE